MLRPSFIPQRDAAPIALSVRSRKLSLSCVRRCNALEKASLSKTVSTAGSEANSR